MNRKESHQKIVSTVRKFYPDAQAIVLFGTYDTPDERPQSDVDIAVLLPHDQARKASRTILIPCQLALEDALKKPVDLLNIREVLTVFQKEIIENGRVLYCVDERLWLEFELLTMSLYQKLNDERREILRDFESTGRAYSV